MVSQTSTQTSDEQCADVAATSKAASSQQPQKWSGYLLKNRRAPMKGWHKVAFVFQLSTLTKAIVIVRL
jgi:hypothetical protein